MKKLFCLMLMVVVSVINAYAGSPIWNLEQSPTSDVLNGISAPNNFYAMGVGVNGSIVEFVNGDNGTVMNSGTDKVLYDVFTASSQLAIATGEDTVLIWDGTDWQPIVSSDTGTAFTGAWITPEKDFAFYQSLGFFNFICPYELGAVTQGFCRGHSSPMLAMCGQSDDIKVVLGNGDILHYNNQLGEANGVLEPLYDQVIGMNLTGVFMPQASCLPGRFKPNEIFAINNTNEFYYFDGTGWSNLGVAVPNDQTLTWLNGSGRNHIVATGFKPNGVSGNDGVVWTFDGNTWTQDTNLPVGTPGLTDVAVNIGLVDGIFGDGFELLNRRFILDDLLGAAFAVAEEGEYLFAPWELPADTTELAIRKTMLTAGPVFQQDIITFQIEIFNDGTEDVFNVELIDGFVNNMSFAQGTCNSVSDTADDVWVSRKAVIPSVAAGESFICTMQFDVIGEVGDEVRNFAAILVDSDLLVFNNISYVKDILIEAD